MTNDQELEDGLAAFDRLSRKIEETNLLLHGVRCDQEARIRHEKGLSEDLKTSIGQATRASQTALQASQVELRSSILWVSLTALLTVLVAFGGGYFFGHKSGTENGLSAGYQKARNEQAAANWANTPSGQRAYGLDRFGSLDMLALCKGDGWVTEHQKEGTVCFPRADAKGNIRGWYIH